MGGPHFPDHVITLPDDVPIWFISDLHLGDGTPSDVFFGKDRHLVALVERVRRQGEILVVAGDALDFHQAWSFTRILRAHKELLEAMSRLGREGRLYYIPGNHDHDINLYREMLNFNVCTRLVVGDDLMLAQHGYEYDPYIGENLDGSHLATKVHHLFERYLNTWLRIPLGEFYTLSNRLMFYLMHKLGLLGWSVGRIVQRLGGPDLPERVDASLNYWSRANDGDSMLIFRPAMERVRTGNYRYLLCGHSHLPGIVPVGDRAYCNTGSWTFGSSQYIRLEKGEVTCADWISGRTFGDELYQPLLDGDIYKRDFWLWWKHNYMGLLRFRCGEERAGRLRGWESYVRDHQHLGNLAQLAPPNPLPTAEGPTPVAEEAVAAKGK